MGNTPTKKGDPENGIIISRGHLLFYSPQRKNLDVFVFLFYFAAVKAFLTVAKEEFNTKWEKPSQVSFFPYKFVFYDSFLGSACAKILFTFFVYAFVG